MMQVLQYLTDPRLWELWYTPYYGYCRMYIINSIGPKFKARYPFASYPPYGSLGIKSKVEIILVRYGDSLYGWMLEKEVACAMRLPVTEAFLAATRIRGDFCRHHSRSQLGNAMHVPCVGLAAMLALACTQPR